MAAVSGLIVLIIGFLPRLQNDVVANSTNSTAAYNTTETLGNSILQLSPYVVLVVAAGLVIAALLEVS